MSTFLSGREQLADAIASTFTRIRPRGLTWDCIGLPAMRRIHVSIALEDARWIVIQAGDSHSARDGHRAEIPFDPDVDIVPRLRATAIAIAEESGLRTPVKSPKTDAHPDDGFSQTLVDLCTEIDWSHHRRPEGTIVVDLDVPGDFRQADLRLDHSGFRATLNFHFADPVSVSSRRALERFVALVSGSIRLVRVEFTDSQQAVAVHAAVRYAFVPGATEIGEALAALSVVARRWAVELDLLGRDEALARTYLAAQLDRDKQTDEEEKRSQ